MINTEEFKKCAEFHGHICGGLTIGYQASVYAIRLLNLHFSEDEDVVCIAENDACSVDAIQVMLGCSVGKGNLLFHITGKQAYSFYERNSGKSIRIVLKQTPENLTKEEKLCYLQDRDPAELFEVKKAVISIPERARIFESYVCENCGEVTGENWIHLCNGRRLCRDCCKNYDRFHI